jgi:hypothetical protein
MSDNLSQTKSVPAWVWRWLVDARCPVADVETVKHALSHWRVRGPEEHLGCGGKFYKWEVNRGKSDTHSAAWSLTNSISVIPMAWRRLSARNLIIFGYFIEPSCYLIRILPCLTVKGLNRRRVA